MNTKETANNIKSVLVQLAITDKLPKNMNDLNTQFIENILNDALTNRDICKNMLIDELLHTEDYSILSIESKASKLKKLGLSDLKIKQHLFYK